MPAQQIPATLDTYNSDTVHEIQQLRKLPRIGAKGFWYALKRTVVEGFLEQGMDRAAMLTYYTVLTCAPALLAIYSIATLVMSSYSTAIASLTDDFIHRYVPSEYSGTVADVVETILGSATGGVIALSIGILTALISSSAYVRAFSRIANYVYRISEGRPFLPYHLRMLGITLVMLVGTLAILVCAVVNRSLVTSVLAPLADTLGIQGLVDFLLNVFFPVWDWAFWPVVFLILLGIIGVLFNYSPNVQQRRFRWFSFGSVLTIIGFALVAKATQLYLLNFAAINSYGAMGAVIAVFTALWAMNTVLITGFKLDAEVERVRQIKAGYPAEEHIQLQPKASIAAEGEQRIYFKLTDEARQFRPPREVEQIDQDDDLSVGAHAWSERDER